MFVRCRCRRWCMLQRLLRHMTETSLSDGELILVEWCLEQFDDASSSTDDDPTLYCVTVLNLPSRSSTLSWELLMSFTTLYHHCHPPTGMRAFNYAWSLPVTWQSMMAITPFDPPCRKPHSARKLHGCMFTKRKLLPIEYCWTGDCWPCCLLWKWNEMKWKVQWFKVRSKTDLEPA